MTRSEGDQPTEHSVYGKRQQDSQLIFFDGQVPDADTARNGDVQEQRGRTRPGQRRRIRSLHPGPAPTTVYLRRWTSSSGLPRVRGVFRRTATVTKRRRRVSGRPRRCRRSSGLKRSSRPASAVGCRRRTAAFESLRCKRRCTERWTASLSSAASAATNSWLAVAIVNGVGPADADLLFVGEAPGANEDEQGEPFVGRSGDVLDAGLRDAGLDRGDVRITNCVRCRPPDNRDPRNGELANCRDYLETEIDRVDPEVVVTLGKVPAEHLLDR